MVWFWRKKSPADDIEHNSIIRGKVIANEDENISFNGAGGVHMERRAQCYESICVYINFLSIKNILYHSIVRDILCLEWELKRNAYIFVLLKYEY